jgi:hypothetical protein
VCDAGARGRTVDVTLRLRPGIFCAREGDDRKRHLLNYPQAHDVDRAPVAGAFLFIRFAELCSGLFATL